MTKAELLLASELLRLAADEFGNHGCNDFKRPSYFSEAEWPKSLPVMHDFVLMAHLANRLTEQASKHPSTYTLPPSEPDPELSLTNRGSAKIGRHWFPSK